MSGQSQRRIASAVAISSGSALALVSALAVAGFDVGSPGDPERFLDPRIHGNPGHDHATDHNHATDHDPELVSATSEVGADKPLPRPKGYVNEAGPAVIDLPTRRIGADRPNARLAAATAVPSAGSWVAGPRIERVVHVFDLPRSMTSDAYLMCAGSGNLPAYGPGAPQQRYFCSEYDHATGALTPLDLTFDMFCATAVHDENGDIILAGGTSTYPKANKEVARTWGGLADTYRYDVSSGAMIRLGDMNYKRWYPEFFKDQDSNVHVHGGQHNGVQIPQWEKMARGETTWQVIPGLSLAMNSYAAMELIAPDVFAFTGAKSSVTSVKKPPFIIDMGTRVQTVTPGLRDAGVRRAAAALALYPAQDEKVLIVGGGAASGKTGTTLVDLIDYSVWPTEVPRFVPRAALKLPTVFPNMVNLPNGQPFLAGGSRAWRTGDILQAAIYDTEADSWTWVAPHKHGRDYHTNMHVLRDGSALMSGGNPSANNFQIQSEIYRPWYLDGRPRPELSENSFRALIPSGEDLPEFDKGGNYRVEVSVPDGSSISRFTLDGARASTHVTSDAGQMMFDVPFAAEGDGTYTLTIPGNYKLTPGAYKISAVTEDLVPSPSYWVRVS